MPEYSIDELVEVGRPVFVAQPLGDVSKTATWMLDFRLIEQVIVSTAELPAFRFDHTPRQFEQFDNEYLLFEMYDHGVTRGLVGDTPSRVDADTMHLVDMSGSYCAVTPGLKVFSAVIPHEAVGYDPSCHPRYLSIPRASDRGRILSAVIDAWRAAIDDPSRQRDARSFKGAFLGLIRTLILEQDHDAPLSRLTQAERGRTIRAYIVRHLSSPGLTADRLAADLGMSRAALYRQFQGEGGVAQYIRQRRLDAAMADLLAAPSSRGAVGRVAERWGFGEAGTFSRSFATASA